MDAGLLESDQWSFLPDSCSLLTLVFPVSGSCLGQRNHLSESHAPHTPLEPLDLILEAAPFPALVIRSAELDLRLFNYFVLFSPKQLSLL